MLGLAKLPAETIELKCLKFDCLRSPTKTHLCESAANSGVFRVNVSKYDMWVERMALQLRSETKERPLFSDCQNGTAFRRQLNYGEIFAEKICISRVRTIESFANSLSCIFSLECEHHVLRQSIRFASEKNVSESNPKKASKKRRFCGAKTSFFHLLSSAWGEWLPG